MIQQVGNRPEHRRNYHLLAKTTITLAVAIAVAVSTLFTLYLRESWRRRREQARVELQGLAITAASRMQTLFGSVLVTVRILDAWIAENPDRDPRFDPEFLSLVEAFRKNTDRRMDLRFVTEQGGLFYIPSKSGIPLADVRDRDYYSAIEDSQEKTMFIAKPTLSRVTGKWGIPMAFRLSPNKFGLLVIFGAIEFNELDSLFADLLITDTRSITITREDQTILYRRPFMEELMGEPINYTVIDESYGEIELHTPAPILRTIGFRTLEEYPLSVSVADSSSVIKRAWQRESLLQSILILVGLALYLSFVIRQLALIAENDRFQTQILHASREDPLTGLKNRRYFFERLEEEMARTTRTGNQLTLIMLDIDHFKMMNDRYGHPEGDAVLEQFADTLRHNTRGIDLCGRIGGEEFLVALVNTGQEAALHVAERIRQASHGISRPEWPGSISGGLAEWRGPEESADDLIRRADGALYRAKNSGRDRIIAATV